MAIEQLAGPCWYARYDGGEDDQNDIHYTSEAQALKAADEIRAEDYGDGVTPAVETGRLPEPCWTAQCDGPAGAHPLEGGEYEWTLHAESMAEIEKWAADHGWIITRDGRVYCEDDTPGCEVADLAVVDQIPGQLTLGEESDSV